MNIDDILVSEHLDKTRDIKIVVLFVTDDNGKKWMSNNLVIFPSEDYERRVTEFKEVFLDNIENQNLKEADWDFNNGQGEVESTCPKCNKVLFVTGLPRWNVYFKCPNCQTDLEVEFDFIEMEGDEWDIYTIKEGSSIFPK